MSDSWICNLAYDGKFEALKQQLCADRTILTKKDLAGRIPLHWAVSGKHNDIVNFLLQQGSPVDCVDEANWTPLMIASSVGHVEIVSALLNRNAKVGIANQMGQTSLHYAASKDHLEDSYGSTPLHRAASLGRSAIVRLFLDGYRNQLDINCTDEAGNTPLHLACEEERVDVAKMLIQAGCRTDIMNKEEKTAFQMAPPSLSRTLQSLRVGSAGDC
ncbi:26S proteasome non-ATPase regulatory subunit 10-like isoform X2 [Dermacentor albipictus]|uniref:26S proteasome non-ATPase regulatory subunit 10-like isoform X2 n=1 Tax=Dermacentor albipictus TaxID=60249 RepID=UPI0031FD6F5B